MSVLIEEEYEGLKSASCSERNVQEGVKKSICWMATSLVLVVLFGFVVLCCLVRVRKGREPDVDTVVCFLEF